MGRDIYIKSRALAHLTKQINESARPIHLFENFRVLKYLQQGVFSPTEGVWAGYELKAMHFRVESSCYGVETEVTTPISGP